MIRLTIALSEKEFERLQAKAEGNLRQLKEEVRFILQQNLSGEDGLLLPTEKTPAPEGQNANQPSASRLPILCLDFDGVLHWYRNGWKGATRIDDIPVPGAQKFVVAASQAFHVVIYSSRSNYEGGIPAMQEWMAKYGFPTVEFATERPPAFVTLDDRAVTFNGMWPNVNDLVNFAPWYQKERQ